MSLVDSGTAGFVGVTRRGPDDRPVPIDSHQRFVEVFGGSPEGGYLDRAVRAFFDNGGRRCLISRVISAGCRAAATGFRRGSEIAELVVQEKGSWANGLGKEAIAQRQVRAVCQGFRSEPRSSGGWNTCDIIAPFSGGRDGIDEIRPADFGLPTGPADDSPIWRLAATGECGMIAAPDLFWLVERSNKTGNGPFSRASSVPTVQLAMIRASEAYDAIALLDTRLNDGLADLPGNDRKSDLAAIFGPWVTGRSGEPLPPSPFVAGVCARISEEIGPHASPANHPIFGAGGTVGPNSPERAAAIERLGLNSLVVRRGVRIWSSVTTSGRDIGTARFLATLRKTVRQQLAWIAFEPNNAVLRQKVTRMLSALCRSLHSAGMLAGRNRDDAFRVVCSEENNTAEDIDQGRINIDLWVSPVRPSRFIRIHVGIDGPGLL